MGRTSDAKEKLLQVATTLIWEQSYASISVDCICAKAKVNKGSFYHFFASKSDLAIAVFDDYWERRRPVYDGIFSAQTPPLERLEQYCEGVYASQWEQKHKSGYVVGCPYASVGSELSTQDENVRKKTAEMFGRTCRYLEAALRDAHAAGLIPRQNFAERAEALYCLMLGKLLQARVKNDVEILKQIYPSFLQLLDVPRNR